MVRKRIMAIILAAAIGMSYNAFAMECKEQTVSEVLADNGNTEIIDEKVMSKNSMDNEVEVKGSAEDLLNVQSDVTLSGNTVTYGGVVFNVNAPYCTYTDQAGHYALIYTSDTGTVTRKGTMNVQHTSDVRYEYFGPKLTPGKDSYVVLDEEVYEYGTDYSVSYKKNNHAGKMVITVKFKKTSYPYKKGFKKIVESVTVVPGTMELKDLDIYFNSKNSAIVKIKNNYTGKTIPKKYYTADLNTRTITMKGDYTGAIFF